MRSDELRALSAENLARLIQFSTIGIEMLDGSVFRAEVVKNPIALEGDDPPTAPAAYCDFVLGRASA